MRHPEYVTFTRAELHELVWSRPMTQIAADFGMSSIALAKHCKKADVPQPQRGYWQQLACGQKPKRRKLPQPRKDTPNEIAIPKYEPRPPTPAVDVPLVVVAERATKPHPVIVELQGKLRGRSGDELNALAGRGHSVLSFSNETKARTLRILDELFKALDGRGHTVRFAATSYNEHRHELSVVVAGKPPVGIRLTEHITRSDHVMTEKEKQDQARYSWSSANKYDYAPSGRLIIDIERPWKPEGMQCRWSDRKTKKLEDQLGEVIVGIEQAAEAFRLLHEEREREERERDEQRKRAEEAKNRAKYFKVLRDDLRRMARRSAAATEIRSFLDAVEEAVPAADRGEGFRKWLEWAGEQADALDPLNAPYTIAKDVEPDAAQLANVARDPVIEDDGF